MVGSETAAGRRRRGERSAIWAAGALLVVAAAGCAGGRQQGGHADGGSVSQHDAPLSCSASEATPAPPPAFEPLPADFVPVSASRCTTIIKTVPGDGEWQFRNEQQADGPFDDLLRALRTPSESPARGPCTLELVMPPVITLTDARGRTTTPAIPQDSCGKPMRKVAQAVEALPWKTVKETKLHQARGQLELDSGCPGGYKPVIAIAGAESSHPAATVAPVFPGAPPTALTVCRYTLDPTNTLSLNGSGSMAIGKLATVATLTGEPVVKLIAGLNAARPVTDQCDRPQAPFAIVFPVGGSVRPSVVIEMGGCNRVESAPGGLGQVTPETVAIVAG